MSHMQQKSWFNLLCLTIPTMGIFALSLWLTLLWRYPTGISLLELNVHIRLFGVLSFVWIIFYYAFGLLDLKGHRRPSNLFSALIGANTLGLITAAVFFYLQPNLIITPRRFLLVDTLCVLVLSTIWQFFIRSMTKKMTRPKVYLINLEQEFQECKNELEEQADLFTIHAIQDTDVSSLLKKQEQSTAPLFFVVPTNPTFSKEVLETFAQFHTRGSIFIRLNDFYEEAFRRVYTTNLNDWWLLEYTRRDRVGIYPVIKRFLDLFFAFMIAIIFLITFPFIFILIKLSDGGNIFFTQTRLSVNGTPFTIYKYRTMRAGTANNTWTEDRDPRVTPIGTFLRKTRLDELPQWINILRGDMSLIGPRPEQAGIVEQLKQEVPYFESRHAIRPGLIGWAQLHVYANNVTESKQKLQYDLYYLKHRSFLFDIEILLKTIAHVFFLNGK